MNKERMRKFNILRRFKTPIMLIVVFCLLSVPFSIAKSSNLPSKLQNLRNQRNSVNNEIEEKSDAAKEKKKEATDLSNSIDVLDGNISETENRISSLVNQISQTKKEIQNTEGEIKTREGELVIENQKKEDTLIELYQTGRRGFWELLISVKTLSEAINHTHYFEILEAKLESTIAKVTQIKNDLENKKSDLDKKKAELASMKGEQQAYKQSLDSQKQEKSIVLEDTEVQQSKLEEQVAEAKKLNSQVKAQIASIQAEVRRSTEKNRGTLPRDRGTSPVGFSWPANYKYISCYYGESTPFQSFHTGIDLVNIPGTPIYAASDGTVVTVRDMMIDGHYYGYGKYVVIGHNAKYSSLYAHLMSYIVSTGQEVKKGDIIGYLGNTGWSTGPHLHFEIWDNGNRANPINYLP